MEVRVATVEKRLRRLEVEGEDFRRQLVALLQGIRDTEADLQNLPSNTCLVTIPFKTTACNGLALQGATVTAQDQILGTTATATTGSDGKATIPIQLYKNSPIFYYGASHASGRLSSTQAFPTGTGSGTCDTTHALITIPFTAASGYVCLPSGAGFVYPVSKTLTLTDNFYGHTATLTWTSGTTWAGSKSGVSVGVCGACPAKTITLTYTFNGSKVTVTTPGLSCPGDGGPGTLTATLDTVSAVTAPGSSTSPTFASTYDATAHNPNPVYCTGTWSSASVTLAE